MHTTSAPVHEATAHSDRVANNTSPAVNRRIRQKTQQRVQRYGTTDRQRLSRRLMELDAEWDIERTLQANAATFSLLGLGLGVSVNRKWLILSGAVSAFLLQHAVQGWCPPLPLLRRLGFRTPREIEQERFALKALRGDFSGLLEENNKIPDAQEAFRRVMR